LPSAAFEAPKLLLSLPATASVSAHPTTSSLVLAHLAIYSLGSDQPAITLDAWTDKGIWATCWSWDGRFVCGVGKDGTIGIWEPRKGTSAAGVRS
jgi:WD40 repeat protein